LNVLIYSYGKTLLMAYWMTRWTDLKIDQRRESIKAKIE
jgi:hypothetical protein